MHVPSRILKPTLLQSRRWLAKKLEMQGPMGSNQRTNCVNRGWRKVGHDCYGSRVRYRIGGNSYARWNGAQKVLNAFGGNLLKE